MSRWLKATFVSSAFVWLCFYSFFPWEVRADDIVITAGPLYEVSPFRPSPQYVSWRARIYANNVGAATGAFGAQNQPITSTCVFPCGAGSPFKINMSAGLSTTTPITSILNINGRGYLKWFRGSEIWFSLDSIIIPVEAASTFTRTTQFMMSGVFWSSGYDLQTGFEPVTMIPFGNGLAGSGERYRYSLSNTSLHQRTGPTAADSSPTGSFTFSKRTKTLDREFTAWGQGTGFRQMFEPQIPARFWRRIDLGDKRIVPATHLPIR
jgi:hypothetical protein